MAKNRALLETILLCGAILALAGSVILFMEPIVDLITSPGFPRDDTASMITPIPIPATITPLTGENVIHYERQGGFATISQVLEIGADGETRLTNPHEVIGTTKLAPDHLASLQADFVRMRFFDLHDIYNIRGQERSDEMVRAVTYTQNDRTRRILIGRNNRREMAPPDLDLLLIELDQIADRILYGRP